MRRIQRISFEVIGTVTKVAFSVTVVPIGADTI